MAKKISNPPVNRLPKPVDISKLSGRNKVVNNQFMLQYQSKEALSQFVSKRGNFEKVSEDYHELLAQAFKVARGLKYSEDKKEVKFVNSRYKNKGNQIKQAIMNELKEGIEVKTSVEQVEKRNKAQVAENKKIKEDLVEGKKASMLGEIVKQNRIKSKEAVEFAEAATKAAGIVSSDQEKKFEKYLDADQPVDEKTQRQRDRQALRNFNLTGSLGGLNSTVSILQENIIKEVMKGNRLQGIEGDAELARMIAELDVKEIYTLSLHKDFQVIFVTSEGDIDESTVEHKEETVTRQKMLTELRHYIELKRKGQAGPNEFARILKIQQESFR